MTETQSSGEMDSGLDRLRAASQPRHSARRRRIHSAGPAQSQTQNHGPCDFAQGDGSGGERRVTVVSGAG